MLGKKRLMKLVLVLGVLGIIALALSMFLQVKLGVTRKQSFIGSAIILVFLVVGLKTL